MSQPAADSPGRGRWSGFAGWAFFVLVALGGPFVVLLLAPWLALHWP